MAWNLAQFWDLQQDCVICLWCLSFCCLPVPVRYFSMSVQYMACHPGGHLWDYYSNTPSLSQVTAHHFDGLMQERRNSIANALELRLSCANTSIWSLDAHRWNLLVPDLQTSCRDLNTWQGTRIIVLIIAATWHAPLMMSQFLNQLFVSSSDVMINMQLVGKMYWHDRIQTEVSAVNFNPVWKFICIKSFYINI